jgi:hypothetical protein
VSPGQSIQAAVDASFVGDTVLLADGNYGSQSVTINKAIRLMAQHIHAAILEGASIEPLSIDAGGSGVGLHLSGAGMMIDGLYLRWHATGIEAYHAGPFTIQNTEVQSALDDGISVYDAINPLVRCNWLLDPYLPNDPKQTAPNGAADSAGTAQMDYGVNCYGCLNAQVIHNYFMGRFNQALSFKEGNVNPTASDNTFEGSRLTAIYFGQNVPNNGPYPYAGLPTGPDVGTLVADRNVFRQARDSRGVYYLRTPITVWNVNATITEITNNVVESSEYGLGIVPECEAVTAPGCAVGPVILSGNIVSGAVTDGGTTYQINTTGCDLALNSWTSSNVIQVTMTNQTCVNTRGVVIDGYSAMFTQSGTTISTSPVPALRWASPATDPLR